LNAGTTGCCLSERSLAKARTETKRWRVGAALPTRNPALPNTGRNRSAASDALAPACLPSPGDGIGNPGGRGTERNRLPMSCIGQADAEDQKKRRGAMECWNRFIWSRPTSYRMVTTAGADCHRQHGAPDRGGPKLTQKGSRPNVRGEGRPISEADGQFRSHVTSNALFV